MTVTGYLKYSEKKKEERIKALEFPEQDKRPNLSAVYE